jgi:uncharacterized integral membrane protein
MKQLIFAIVIALLTVIFALQNTTIVTVNIFLWHVSMSLALLIVVLLAAGVLTGLLMMSKKIYNKNVRIKMLQKQVDASSPSVKI